MTATRTSNRVTVRSAEDLGHALGLSAADTAEMDFGRNSPSPWPKSFKPVG